MMTETTHVSEQLTSSEKTRLMAEQTVFAFISLFSTFIFIDDFKIVQRARKLFSADDYIWRKVKALIRRRAKRMASDPTMFFLSLNKPTFLR